MAAAPCSTSDRIASNCTSNASKPCASTKLAATLTLARQSRERVPQSAGTNKISRRPIADDSLALASAGNRLKISSSSRLTRLRVYPRAAPGVAGGVEKGNVGVEGVRPLELEARGVHVSL